MSTQQPIPFNEFDWRIIEVALKKHHEYLREGRFYRRPDFYEGRIDRDIEFLERELIPKVRAQLGQYIPDIAPPKFSPVRFEADIVKKKKKAKSTKKRK